MFFISVPRSAQETSHKALARLTPQEIIRSSFDIRLTPIKAGQIISTQAFITSDQAQDIIDLSKEYPGKKDLLGGKPFINYLKEQLRF